MLCAHAESSSSESQEESESSSSEDLALVSRSTGSVLHFQSQLRSTHSETIIGLAAAIVQEAPSPSAKHTLRNLARSRRRQKARARASYARDTLLQYCPTLVAQTVPMVHQRVTAWYDPMLSAQYILVASDTCCPVRTTSRWAMHSATFLGRS